MINVELYFNGQIADTDEVDTIAATYSLNTLGKIKTRQGARTNTYVLPFTPRNKRIFENSELLNNATNLPYTLMEHSAWIEGVEVFSGFAVIDSTERGYEVQGYGTNSEFFSVIKDKNIRDLDLSEWNHMRDDLTIRNSWNNTEGYTYAFVDYGKYASLQPQFSLSGFATPIMKHDLYPAVYYKTVIEKIAAEAGYRLTGKVMNNPEFTQKVIPHTYDKPGKELDYGFKGSRMPPYRFPTGDENDAAIVNFTVEEDPFDCWDEARNGYVSPVSQTVTIKMNLTWSVGMPNVLILYVFKRPAGNNSTNVRPDADGAVSLWFAGIGASSRDEEIITIENVGLLRGETVFVGGVAANGDQSIGFRQFEITTTQVMNSYDTEWNVSDNLPDIKQGKFFLDFLMHFNLIPNTNFSEGVIDLAYFDDVESNPAVDWSRKIDGSEKPKVFYKFNDYAQSNLITYKTDDVLTNGHSYNFLIDNKTLPPSATEYESPFFLPEDGFLYGGTEKALAPKTLTLKSQYVWKGKWDSAVEYIKDDVVYLQQGSWHIAKETNTNVNPAGSGVTQWKYAAESDIWDIKKRVSVGMLKNGKPLPVVFDDGTFDLTRYVTSAGLNWPYIFSRYYKSFEGILDKTKIMEILMKLNYSDINQLDQTRPIYIREYNSKFYLDEVTQFKFNEVDSTVCRLIRL